MKSCVCSGGRVLGVLLIGIAVMDGFDMGIAILLPIVGRTDMERRIVINTVGPVWEGNQVWFILGGGAIFAAWPPLYAVAFSGFYLAMLLLLRVVDPAAGGIQGTAASWRARGGARPGTTALFLGGLVPALVFGVAFGNTLQGVPFRFDDTLRMTYTGSLFGLFSPFAVLCGLVSVAMITMHGATWLACKTEGAVRSRAQAAGIVAALALAVLFILGGVWAANLDGYVLQSFAGVDAPSNPMHKHVIHQAGALMNNYSGFAMDDGRAVARGCRRAATALLVSLRRLRVLAFVSQRVVDRRRDRHRRGQPVSLHAALVDRCHIEPDGVGRVVSRNDTDGDDRGDGDLPADRAGLHGLGLPRAARAGHRGGHRG